MTYWGVLGVFVAPPVAALTVLVARRVRRTDWVPYAVVLALAVVALVYTAPWDNFLVATRVWWYDEALVTGLTIGWVPVEEYAFFALQALLTGLWTVYLLRVAGNPRAGRSGGASRLGAVGVAGTLWVLAAGLWLSGWRPGTYLALILAWALIPAMLQLAFGADILRDHHRLLVAAIGMPTIYLWGVDFLAIQSGTWTLDPAQTLGIALGGVLPVEEMVFFLMTNVLICFGVVLALTGVGRRRAGAILARVGAALLVGRRGAQVAR